jgi:6-phosphogluconolactonase
MGVEMIINFLGCGFLIAFSLMLSTSQGVNANEPLVFISAFAAGDQGAIHAYQLDLSSGQLKQTHKTTDVEHPFFLAVSPNNKYLYSIHAKSFGGKENEHVAAYKIVGARGQLKLLNRQSALGTAACYLDVYATGKTVVVANYSTGSVASLPVREDGSLGEAATFVQHEGSSIDPARQEGPHAHCIVVSPDNQFFYAADLGLDQVLGYRLDAKTSKLSPNEQPFVKTQPGAGPRHLTFHPNGKHAYVINELTNTVTLFDYDSKSGMLTKRQTIPTLPKDFAGTSHCADLKITPNGRFLYGTNRGHDSIAAYEIGDNGRLTLLGIEPSLGKGPQNLAIAPGGKLLLCANMSGNNVAVFQINAETGGLKSVGEPIEITSPSCIMIPSTETK